MVQTLGHPFVSVYWIALVILSLTHISSCFPSHLESRQSSPSPISVPPAQNWEGVDGTWNTFVLQVGDPAQVVRVMLSTSSQQQWVIDPRGCSTDACGNARGGLFDISLSSTWHKIGLYELWTEKNLGLVGNANYGLDTVSLGYSGEGGPTLHNQTVGALAVHDFYFGHLGINPKPTNWTNFTEAQMSPSLMTSLKDQGMIPSVSWGYTAGVPYRFAKVLASLTLGGYDSERFVPNGVSFPFAPDNERDILVSITGVHSMDSSGTQTSLLTTPIYSYIDSTVAEIWMPLEVCVKFEQAFNLTYDETSELYLLTAAEHNALLVANPNITITVAPYTGSSGSVDITLPYAAFDLTAQPPYQGISNSSQYFPLRRAANSTQYTLGRTFLQEAYLTVDWERFNFSVAQCNWANGSPASPNIVPITSVNNTKSGNPAEVGNSANKVSPLGAGAIAGIAVGGLVIILGAIVGTLLYLKKKQRQHKRLPETPLPKSTNTDDSASTSGDDAVAGDVATGTNVFPKAELDASESKRHEAADEFYKPAISGIDSMVESDSKEKVIYEMPGDMPQRQEADGRLFSEKEVMRHREERINGVDPGVSPITPTGSDERSPTSTSNTGTLPSSVSSRPTGRRLVTPGEIMELGPMDGATQLVSPVGGSDNGVNTLMLDSMTSSPMSPLGGSATQSSSGNGSNGRTPTDTERKRFSYEDP